MTHLVAIIQMQVHVSEINTDMMVSSTGTKRAQSYLFIAIEVNQ